MVRKLLVGSAQYILGPFGPDTDLRRHGTTDSLLSRILLHRVNLKPKRTEGFADDSFFTYRDDGRAVSGEIFPRDSVNVGGGECRYFLSEMPI